MAKINRKKDYFTMYSLMRALTVLALLGLWCVFGIEGETEYVNCHVVINASILTVLSWFMINDSRKKHNSLLVVLVLWLLLFVVFRVISLNYTDFSVCLGRCGARSTDVANALLHVILATAVIWMGIRQRGKNKETRVINVRFKSIYVKRALTIYWIALLFNIFGGMNIPVLSDIAEILKNYLFSINSIVFVLIIYVLLVWRKTSHKERFFCCVTLASYILFLTLGGSRSGLFTMFKMIVYAVLALGYRSIKKKYVYLIGAAVPIMVFVFIYSTYMRQNSMRDSTVGEKIELVSEASEYGRGLDTRLLLGPVFDRIGFLDYTTEMYVQRKGFRGFINCVTEVKSIVDNALTPGFDVFDAPKISNLIANYYENGRVVLSKSANSKLDYHSDELTLIGESIVLFGIPFYLVFLLLVGRLFKSVWKRAYSWKNEERIYIRAICLYLFGVLLSSFGIDWFILDLVSFVLTYLIFKFFVYRRKRVAKRVTESKQLQINLSL